MSDPSSAWLADLRVGDVLDESDPHAGDDADWWEWPEPANASAEPSPLLFWKGLLLGLVLSAAAWCVLVVVFFALL